MKCFLIFTIISMANNPDTNTQPRTWNLQTFSSKEQCETAGKSRPNKDFENWILFEDNEKQAKTECVCFNQKDLT